MVTERPICQSGGVCTLMRMNIMSGAVNGKKDSTVASVPFGWLNAKNHVVDVRMSIMPGMITNCCASCSVLKGAESAA